MQLRSVRSGVVDQAFSSGSNVLAVLAASRISDVANFGYLAIALTALTALLAISRGLLGAPLTLLAGSPEMLHEDASFSVTSAIMLGIVAGGLGAVLAVAVGAPPVALVLCAAAPLVLAQDTYRYFAMSAGQAPPALVADGMWFACSVGLWVATFATGAHPPIEGLFAVWAMAAGVGAVHIGQRLRTPPRLDGWFAWARNWDKHRFRLGGESSIGAVGSLAQIALISFTMGPAASAALRGSATLLGPLSLLISSMSIAVVPELRRLGHDMPHIWKGLRRLAWGMAATAASVGLVGTLLPSRVGEGLVGASWQVIQPIVWITAIEYIGQSWLAVGNATLRAHARTSDVLRLRIMLSTLGFTSAVSIAMLTHNIQLVAAGLALSSCVSALLARRWVLTRNNETIGTARTLGSSQ